MTGFAVALAHFDSVAAEPRGSFAFRGSGCRVSRVLYQRPWCGGASPSPSAARAPGAYLARISSSRVWCRSKAAAASPSIFRSPGLAVLGLLRCLLLPAVGAEVEPRNDGPAASEL